MAHRFFDMGEHTYFVVPSDPAGFVIIDLACDCEIVDAGGEVADDDAARHRYATRREAEGAIERWRLAEDDRRQFEAMRRMLLKGVENPATAPEVRALIGAMFPPA